MMSDNELIAEFMGLKRHPKETHLLWVPIYDSWNSKERLEYHREWSWLMPVVEKIEKIKGIHTVISELGCDIYSFGKRVSNSREDTKIKTVYKAVVEFIKWHNQQQS